MSHEEHKRFIKKGSKTCFDNLSAELILVKDHLSGTIIFEKNAQKLWPIASITKLMTGMVVLDAQLSLSEKLVINDSDSSNSSRMPNGSVLTREKMLLLALMSSENRCASALARYYPGGKRAFVYAMNCKARSLGMSRTYFLESTGLNSGNVATPEDLVVMLNAVAQYNLLCKMSITSGIQIFDGQQKMIYKNTNLLVNNPDWQIEISKTGHIPKAGKCLLMRAWINRNLTDIVLLNAAADVMRFVDAMSIKSLLECTKY